MASGKAPTDAECEETLRLLELHGNATSAADAIGISPRTFRDRVSIARRRKTGMIITGRSTLTDLRTGEPVMEWVKESLDRQRDAEAQQAAYAVLAAKLPRYAARGGWHAMRSATAVTYHKQFGEVGRSTASPDMLQ